MGNKLFTKSPNDCCGPEITQEEIKALTYTGFTLEELHYLSMQQKNTKNNKPKKNVK